MHTALASILILPSLLLLLIVTLPSAWANRSVRKLRQVITSIAGLQFIIASTMAVAYVAGAFSTLSVKLLAWSETPLAATVYYDGVASLMLALVSFVGWVICRYSIRYLDGEATQGQYFQWTGFTIGAVSLMVVSGNLLMFMAAWVMTSLGLHKLLLHYGYRPAARRAAWTKFTISRLGDLALIGAFALIYSEFKTFEFSELFAAVGMGLGDVSTKLNIAAFLLIGGAITKSAQVPFHTWLPLTMETPTPVSALMHAGIVNAGGYLVIRTCPLVSLSPGAMATLALFGALTACFAAMVMLTQTSVKKSLAYSTIAQMGFMLLQCGLGAFSAAMLHILAHSLYKAHAFLSSGSVMTQRAATVGVLNSKGAIAWPKVAFSLAFVVAAFATALTTFGINPSTKPGGLLLGGILCLALTAWICQVSITGSRALLLRSLAVSALLAFVYVGSYVAVDHVVAASLPAMATPGLTLIVSALVALGFGGLYLLQAKLTSGHRPEWVNAWYIHASNGFYTESLVRRVFSSVSSSSP